MPPKPARSHRAGPVSAGCFFTAFFSIWAPLTLGFDSVVAYGVVRQWLATGYPTTPATITSSELKTSRSSKGGTSYRADISYRYSVAGREYTSSKWRYAQWNTTSSAEPRTMVARYPVGGPGTAHYDPSNPADAILEPGVRNSDAFMLLFFAPFNAVVAGGAAIGVLSVRNRRLQDARPGGLIITEAGGVVRARLPQMVPPSVASIGLGGVLAFFAIFGLGFPYGFGPPIALSFAALAGAAGAGVLCYAVLRARLASGRRDLIVDPVRRVLTLPKCVDAGRAEVAFARISGIAYRPGTATRNGVKSTEAVLKANGFEYRLAERYDRDEALALGNWLLEQTGRGRDSEEALPDAVALADPD